jgi:NTE family protein
MWRRFTAVALLFLVSMIAAEPAQAQRKPLQFRLTYATIHGGLKTAVVPAGESMPRLGLALAGGGARAAASIGVLKVLAREGIPVSAVAGTSMGAGVGGLFAAGYRPEEIEQIFLANDWNDIFRDTPARAFLTQEQKEAGSRHLLEFTFRDGRFMPPSGLSAGQKLTNLLAAKTLAASFEADLDFNRLRIPFRAIATDIETGDAVVLSRGPLHDAIRASMAIPLVFQPVEMQGRLLVDGGLVNNLPVEVARAMGSEVVIAVDASAKLEKKEQITSLIEIMSQSISLQVRRESERQAALADLVITPDTSEYSFADFPLMKDIIRKGEEAARAALPRIRELMKPENGLAAGAETFRITSLLIRGNVNVSDATIRYAVTPALFPHEANTVDVQKTLADVFRLGYFSDVALDLEKEGAGYRGVLTVTENPVVKAISLSGNTIIPSGEMLSVLGWQINQPLNATRLAAGLDKLIERYRSQGNLLAHVEHAGVKPDGTLEIAMYEGRIDSITITGHTKTSRYLIRRETRTRVGQPLNFETAAHDIQHLYALDYFESLAVDVAKSPQGGVDLTLKIKEKPANKIRLGLRYDLDDSFTGLTDIVVDNVGGRGVKLFLNTRYGNYTDITFGYRSPVVLRTYFVHTVDGFYQKRNYFIYEDKHKVQELDITRTGAELAFGYQWFRFGDTYLRYRYASDSTTETLGAGPPKEIARIGSLAFLSTMDTRDSSTFAHKGTLLKGSYESAAPAYGGNIKYTKTGLYGQGFIPLGERHTLILEATGGIGGGTFPYEEKYGIGGADYLISTPLLGYQRREFVGDDLLGFSAAYRWKIGDYQLNIVKAVYLNLAYQAANVWDKRDDMTVKDLRSGGGIGLYADTIIGPVRLDFGMGEQHRYAVYFSAGFDF